MVTYRSQNTLILWTWMFTSIPTANPWWWCLYIDKLNWFPKKNINYIYISSILFLSEWNERSLFKTNIPINICWSSHCSTNKSYQSAQFGKWQRMRESHLLIYGTIFYCSIFRFFLTYSVSCLFSCCESSDSLLFPHSIQIYKFKCGD